MKYWVFQNNQVIGPFDREAVAQVAGFSSETLVCPEGRKGTQMGDWQRASVVPDMAEALLAATRVPAMARAGLERGPGSTLPPEPTLRDLAVLGNLQERVTSLESLSTKLQDELRSRDVEISRLKVELDQKARAASDLQSKLADLEVKTYGLAGVKDELERAKEDARVAGVRLEEHQRALEELRAKVGGTAAPSGAEAGSSAFGAFSQGAAPGPAPLSEAPSLGPSPFTALGPTPGALGSGLDAPAAASAAGSIGLPMGGPKSAGMGRLGEAQAAPPADPFAPQAAEPPAKAPEAAPADPFALPSSSLSSGPSGPEPLVSLGGPPGDPFPAPAGLAAAPIDLAEPPKSKRDSRVIGVIVAMALLVVGGVFLLGGKKKKKKLAAPPPELTAPTPAPEARPDATPPSEPALDLTQAAVEFVKAYQIPGRQETVAQLLETRYPTTGRLSPWMVEKIDNDKYEVNFWSIQSEAAAEPKPAFKFQVRMRSKLLQGLNPPALALLNDGTVPAPEAAKPKRRGRASRPASGGGVDAAKAVLEGLTAGAKAAEPAAAKPAKAGRKAKGRPAAQESGSEGTQLPPEPESAGAGKSDEEEMLDELLLPGMDKKTPARR